MPTLYERFTAKVGPEDETTGCWPWLGAKIPRGYGSIMVDGRQQGAHRVAWTLFYGAIPEGQIVRHLCANKMCVRPAHLALGTHADNMDDYRDDRARRGLTGLSARQVSEVRERFVRQYQPAPSGPGGWRSNMKELAAEYGVTRETIGRLVR